MNDKSEQLISMLEIDNKAMRLAGNKLAAAALRVCEDYDGIHRLNLAIADWAKTIANEGGRKLSINPQPTRRDE